MANAESAIETSMAISNWLMRCNKAINPVEAIRDADNIGKGLRNFYGESAPHWYTFATKRKELNEAGKETGKMLTTHWNVGKMAGTAFGSYALLNSTYRFLSGGGIYKDSDGNTDIVGIPFI